MFKSLRRLLHYIKILGFKSGWRYWSIANSCAKNPQLVLEWADGCDDEARLERLRGNMEEAELFEGWAKALRDAYDKYAGEFDLSFHRPKD